MTITYPLDLLSDFPGWTTKFEPMLRQEQARTAAGRTYTKDLGPSLWQLTAASKPLKPNELDYWRARLSMLSTTAQTFYGRSLSRCYPILYPRGTWPTGGAFSGTATLASIATGRQKITVEDLPAGYKFSVGDHLSIGNDLHQVQEEATADGSGITPEFTVWPNIWPGVVADVDLRVHEPRCLMTIVPGSVDTTADPQTGDGVVSFQAVEDRG